MCVHSEEGMRMHMHMHIALTRGVAAFARHEERGGTIDGASGLDARTRLQEQLHAANVPRLARLTERSQTVYTRGVDIRAVAVVEQAAVPLGGVLRSAAQTERRRGGGREGKHARVGIVLWHWLG